MTDWANLLTIRLQWGLSLVYPGTRPYVCALSEDSTHYNTNGLLDHVSNAFAEYLVWLSLAKGHMWALSRL